MEGARHDPPVRVRHHRVRPFLSYTLPHVQTADPLFLFDRRFQEAFKSQVDDLQTLLGEGWSWVGVGRDDGYQAGEYSPIFYNSDLYESISHEYVWLSPTPSVPGSKGWDAVSSFLPLILH